MKNSLFSRIGVAALGLFLGQAALVNQTSAQTSLDAVKFKLAQPDLRETGNIGDTNFSTGFRLPGFKASSSLNEESMMRSADIKAGPIYLDLIAASSTLLLSDNQDLEGGSRNFVQHWLIGVQVAFLAKFTENLQFSLAGNLVYEPLEGRYRMPLDAFSLLDPAMPAAQLTHMSTIGGWEVAISDDLAGRYGTFKGSSQGIGVLLSNGSPDGPGYSFYSPEGLGSKFEKGVSYITNSVGIRAGRLLPAQTRVNFGTFHEDLFYIEGQSKGLPGGRNVFYATAESERENLRFKPFADYHLTQVNGSAQQLNAGLKGPITEQLGFMGSSGAAIKPDGATSLLWKLNLSHVAGAYTVQSLNYSRTLDDFNQALLQSLGYRLNQTLGPSLSAALNLSHSKSESLSGEFPDLKFYLAGLNLTQILSSKTSTQLGFFYTNGQSGGSEKVQTYMALWGLTHAFTDKLSTSLMYRHYRRYSKSEEDTYENSVFIYLSQQFN